MIDSATEPPASRPFETGLDALRVRLDAARLDELATRGADWLTERGDRFEDDLHGASHFLLEWIEEERARLSDLQERARGFERLSARTVSGEERRQLILQTARQLGSEGRRLWADAKALSRWFDEVAVGERFERAIGQSLQRIRFACERLGALAATHLGNGSGDGQRDAWRELPLEKALWPLLDRDQHVLIVSAVLRCWTEAARALHPLLRPEAFSSQLRQRVTRLAQDRREPIRLQLEALDLLEVVERGALRIVTQQRLATPVAGDDFFVRAHIVKLVGGLFSENDGLGALLALATEDPSAMVRQEVARQLRHAPIDVVAELWLELLEDEVPQVRGAAFDVVPDLVEHRDLVGWLATSLRHAIVEEQDGLVARVGIEALLRGYERLEDQELAAEWWRDSMETLAEVRSRGPSIPVRRAAAETRELLWLRGDPEAQAIAAAVQEPKSRAEPGESRMVPREVLDRYGPRLTGRVLAALTIDDFPLELERTLRGDRLTRGFRFRFRLWRFLHEMRYPQPDKRQAFRHTIGRVHYGHIRAPSARLAELAETKVPGEPLHIAEEGGWRPYLPLVDDFLSALNQLLPGDPTLFFSPEGVTEVRPPKSLWGRLRAYLALNWHYARFASLRNWEARGQSSPTAYLDAMARLGFRVGFRPHEERPGQKPVGDPSVMRFFPVALLPFGGDLWTRFLDYSMSIYENSLFDLALFSGLLLLAFLGRHAWSNWSLHRSRRGIGLIVGGWGTRGKSSVERLKAALFNALGYGVVSKTTGCEAMLLVSPPFGTLQELFLFRPYDKATIWEQRDVVRTAERLRADVFLWECMGLTPSYVDVLQRQWMRDHLSTVTNTYPDHEDIQGPAGINIPEVMTQFIPEGGTLITSEEQMLPILRDAARARGTRIDAVGWKEAALIPPEVLARFPYEEHPYNVALVAEMARTLGVDTNLAYMEMADRVVPDLGVLKTYPEAGVLDRYLEFSNGMSANERHGCLSNWRRLGLDVSDPLREPGRWITTVVNNRADRIPRSKVFAKILVEDVSADRHVLIGGNLTGLRGYLEESWAEYAKGITFWPDEAESPEAPEEIFTRLALWFRQAVSAELVRDRLEAMLGETASEGLLDQLMGVGGDEGRLRVLLERSEYPPHLIDDLLVHHLADLRMLSEFTGLRDRLAAGDDSREALLRDARERLRAWFMAKVIVVEDYYATGDEIIGRIAGATPPRFRNHVVGVQNIKGTGLDFVYRWQAWERCHDSCVKLRSEDPRSVSEGARELLSTTEFGLLCGEAVREATRAARAAPVEAEVHPRDLEVLERRLESDAERWPNSKDDGARTGGGSPLARLAAALSAFVENILDAGDAIRRRKKADLVYRDLMAQRISMARAIRELQELTKRQKGGWLQLKLTFGRRRRQGRRQPPLASSRA